MAGKSGLGWHELKALFFAMQDGCCAYCGCTMTIEMATMDHVTPLSKGGSNGWQNVIVACWKCNNYKGDSMPTLEQLVRIRPFRRKVSEALRARRKTGWRARYGWKG